MNQFVRTILPSLFPIALLLSSCQKESYKASSSTQLIELKEILRERVPPEVLAAFDFSKTVVTPVNNDNKIFKIPIKGKTSDFVLIKANTTLTKVVGGTIHIEGAIEATTVSYNGEIEFKGFDGKLLLSSSIEKGYIKELQTLKGMPGTMVNVVPTPSKDPGSETLPEVIVIGYLPNNNNNNTNIQWETYVMAQSLAVPFEGNGSAPGSTGGGASGSESSSNPSTYIPLNPTENKEVGQLEIEPEYAYSLPSISLEKYLQSFDLIPSSGATYKVTLCVDVPVNNKPETAIVSKTMTIGHSFFTITKANGNKSLTQSFGFYGETFPAWYAPFDPVPSVIRDNGDREINASLEINVSNDQFNNFKTALLENAKKPYAITDYNCTNFAVESFNTLRSIPLDVKPTFASLGIGGAQITIKYCPSAVFKALQQIKNDGGPESSKVKIDLTSNTRSPISHGE